MRGTTACCDQRWGEKRSPENLRSGGKGPWRRENVVGKWDRRLERERKREREEKRREEKEREREKRDTRQAGKDEKGTRCLGGGWSEGEG